MKLARMEAPRNLVRSVEKPVVLVVAARTTERMRSEAESVLGLASVYYSSELAEGQLDEILPRVDVMMILGWPKFLKSSENLAKMKRLRLIQSVLAGVDYMPFRVIPDTVMICSNRGGFTNAVAEHAWSLILASGKTTNLQYDKLKRGEVSRGYQTGLASDMKLLEGSIFGVVGLGSIGKHAARIARAFGMQIYGVTRSGVTDFPCEFIGDTISLPRLLTSSDILLLAAPLTRQTRQMIRERELKMMKEDAVLVNIARADLVDQRGIYEHLRNHPNFRYATDVWWTGRDGEELFAPAYPFFELPNFLGTPHTSGPLAFMKGRAFANALENVARYLKREKVNNLVNREDYI